MITAAVFDTKPDDRQAPELISTNDGFMWHYLEFRLMQDTADAAKNARAVCVLVNDQLDRLFTFPNVLITSHQAFLTHEASTEIARTTVDNISASAGQESFVEGSVVT